MGKLMNLTIYVLFALSFILSYVFEHSEKFNADLMIIGFFDNSNFGGKFKFLTFLNLYVQMIYFAIRSLNELYEIVFDVKGHRTITRRFCNFIYTTVIFPVGACVTLQFWGIYFVDRELIFPKILDTVVPSWHNHILHTLPLIAAIVDNLTTHHVYKRSFFWGVLPTVLYAIGYLVWITVVYYYVNFWVYPVLEVLGSFYRSIFFLASILILIGLYKLGEFINSSIWRNKVNSKSLKQN